MSTRLVSSKLRALSMLCRAGHSSNKISEISARQYASSSKSTLDGNSQPVVSGAQKSNLTVFDAPSKPSERFMGVTSRSPFSLNDPYSARRRLTPSSSPTHRVRSSTSAISGSTSTPSSTTSGDASNAFAQNVNARIFDSPSRPREYYTRPQRKRDLPNVKSPLYLVAILAALGLSTWGAFIMYATNMERVSSSVVRQLTFNMKSMDEVKEALGDDVHLEGTWWLGGEPWVDGAINLLQGNVDVSFRVKGSKGGGTVYFTSVREEKGRPFTILRHKIICDNGEILRFS